MTTKANFLRKKKMMCSVSYLIKTEKTDSSATFS